MFALVFVPMISVTGMNYGIGGRIRGLRLGIVNDEVDSIEQCANRSLGRVETQERLCLPGKASCRFIDEFDEDVAEKVGDSSTSFL